MDIMKIRDFELAHQLYLALFQPVDEMLGGNFTIYIFGSELESIPFSVLLQNHRKKIIRIFIKNF